MKEIIISAIIAAVVSVAINKIAAAYTFKVIDSYVEDVMKEIKKLVSYVRESIGNAHGDK